MKVKFSIFITTIAILLFGFETIVAQNTKAYFKKNGQIVFESAISDIDSIIFRQVNDELRYDGVYYDAEPTYTNYLRFYEDGLVILTSSTGTITQIKNWFNRENSSVNDRGEYKIVGDSIYFQVTSNDGSIDYNGQISQDKIVLNSYSHINGNIRNNVEYLFGPWVQPNIAFTARNPITESLYTNGFFEGSRVNFNLVVYDAAGMTSITITEVAQGTTPNGISGKITQTRVIPISGAGTYPLSQEMWNGNQSYANIYSGFTYTVSAYGMSYTTKYSGSYDSYMGNWTHYFGIK